MNNLAQWQTNNDHYLAAAMAWLRLGLARLAGSSAAVRAEMISSEAPSCGSTTDVEFTKAADAMAAAAKTDPPPALVILGRRLGLSLFEQNILLLCAAMEFDTRIPRLCAEARGDPINPAPSFALAMTLFADPAWEALAAERPLRYWRLIEIDQPGATPLTQSALRADERIVNYIKGLNELDDRLAMLLTPFDLAGEALDGLAESHHAIAEAAAAALMAETTAERPPVIQLTGIDTAGKQQIALHIFSRMGLQGVRLPEQMLPSAAGELEHIARLWQRESLLLPLALYIDTGESGESDIPAESRLQLNRFVSRCRTLIIVDSREPRSGLGPGVPAFEVARPTAAEQAAAWRAALGGDKGVLPARLAGQFNLDLPAIRHIAITALAEEQKDTALAPLPDRIREACLCRTRPRLGRLARHIDCKATWQDLVLCEEPLRLLQQIAAQVRQRHQVYDGWGFRRKMSRGFGISALFAGESGTGKTMAAEVIANELQMDLYRIDLSAVVSKYIGETEKNLRQLFDAAEDGGVILLFDEADALFGKRSEIKDSHDRYANIEINYLLQRIEDFSGLAILTTNMKSALDQAFMRRLRFIVSFAFPDTAERRQIWQRVFPQNGYDHLAGTPLEELDYNHLARLNLSGGSIHNVALHSAFLAAQAGKSVSMPLLFDAVRTELRKLEKPVNEGDFRPTGQWETIK